MKCPNCSNEIEKGWNFCPRCGARFRRDFFSSMFDRMFSRMNSELRDMGRTEKNIEALDLSPFFNQIRPIRFSVKPQGSGFTIRIVRSGQNPPRIKVRTFGNIDRERVREQVKTQLGRLGFKPGKPPKTPNPSQPQKPAQGEPRFEEPRSVEEPKTKVERLGNRVVVNLEMPGVKSPQDIDIKELESSLEIKASAGDKAYFKILTKPERFRLSKKDFSNGVLHLEFS